MEAAEPGALLHGSTQASFDKNLDALQRVEGVETWIGSEKKGDGMCLPRILRTTGKDFLRNSSAMQQEVFGPAGLVVVTESVEEMLEAAWMLHGQLTATLVVTRGDLESAPARKLERLLAFLKAGRVNHDATPRPNPRRRLPCW
jgi:NADP-dependent aldehyde dehydrogenase